MENYSEHMAFMAELVDRLAREMETTAARMAYSTAPHRIYVEGGTIKIAPIKEEDYWRQPDATLSLKE